MKNLSVLVVLLFSFGFFFMSCQDVNQPEDLISQKGTLDKVKCTTIQSGQLLYATGHYLAGQPLKTGYDIFGYNYQAMQFNGTYANAYLGRYGFSPYQGDDAAYLAANPTFDPNSWTWLWPYRNDKLAMKWNAAWLSNQDCDGDGKLDRHLGYASYIGSGAWLTNHQSGEYYDVNGNICKWTYFVKIIAVPVGSYPGLPDVLDPWGFPHPTYYNADGSVIGYEIWDEFAVVQEVNNDPCAGFHGLFYKGPSPGLGGW